MPNQTDPVEKVYGAMSAKYKMKQSQEEFREMLKSKDNRRKVFEAMSKEYTMKQDFDQFSSTLGRSIEGAEGETTPLLSGMWKSFKGGMTSADEAEAGYEAALGAMPQDKYLELRQQYEEIYKSNPVEAKGFLKKALFGLSGMTGPILEGEQEGAITGAATASLAAATGNVAMVPAAYAAGSRMGSAMFWYKQGAGTIYNTMTDSKVPANIASPISLVAGIPYAAIEMAQIGKILGKKTTKDLMQKSTISVIKAIAKAAGRYGKDVGKEVGEEVLQNLVEVGATELGKVVSNYLQGTNLKQTTIDQIVQGTIMTAKETVGPMALAMLFTHIPAAMQDIANLETEDLQQVYAMDAELQGRSEKEETDSPKEPMVEKEVDSEKAEELVEKQKVGPKYNIGDKIDMYVAAENVRRGGEVTSSTTSTDMLNVIIESDATTEGQTNLARKLLDVADEIEVYNVKLDEDIGFLRGLYKPSEDIITVNDKLDVSTPDGAKTALHEMVHKVTSNTIAKYLNSKEFGEKAGTLNPKEKTFVSRLEDIMNQALPNLPERIREVMNLHEFIAYGLTTPQFQDMLSNIQYKNTNKTVWQKIVDAMKEFFGVGVEDTTLDALVNLSEDIFRGEKGKGKGTDLPEISRPAPAEFIGIQKTLEGEDDLRLYNLTEDIEGHPKGSTITAQTLREKGYTLPEDLPDITAYHGTPHAFSKFDQSKIGMGEGTQWEGWGLYFSDEKEIAKWYANSIAEGRYAKAIKGFPLKGKLKIGLGKNIVDEIMDLKSKKRSDEQIVDAVNKLIRSNIENSRSEVKPEIIEELEKVLPVKSLDDIDYNPGLVYKVRLGKNKTPTLIDRYESVPSRIVDNVLAQAKREGINIKEVLSAADFEPKSSNIYVMNRRQLERSGRSLYDSINVIFRDPEKTSKFLSRAGIDGVRYKAANETGYNYVIFDDSNIEIDASKRMDDPAGIDLLALENFFEQEREHDPGAKIESELEKKLGLNIESSNKVGGGKANTNTISMYLRSPESALMGNRKAADWARRISIGQLLIDSNMSDHRAFFDEFIKKASDWARKPIHLIKNKRARHLNEKEQIATRIAMKHIREMMRSKSPYDVARINQLIKDNKIYAAAHDINTWFDKMLEKIKEYKRLMYRISLPKKMYEAFESYLSEQESGTGKILSEVAEEHKVDLDKLSEYVAEYKEIDNWGISDYVTNLERGSYKVYSKFRDSKGKYKEHMVTAQETRHEANKKMKELQNRNPDLRLFIRFESERVNPFKARKGTLKGADNIFDVLNTYAYRVEKRMALEPVKASMEKEFEKDNLLPPEQRQYPDNVRKMLRDALDDAAVRYHMGDRIFNEILESWFGKRFLTKIKPHGFSRGVAKLRKITGSLKLGYRLVAGAVNYMGGNAHIYAKYGISYMRRGSAFLKTEEGKRFIIENKHLLGMDFAAEVTGRYHTKLPWYHPMKVFSAPEPGIRKLNLATAYLANLDAGMTKEQAVWEAGRAVAFQNFTYNTAALPKIMRSPGGKLVFQFKPYFVKEIEFMSSLKGKEIARYAAYQLAFAGPRGLLYLLKSLPILGALGLLTDVEKKLETTEIPESIPIIGGRNPAYGLVGMLTGADITQAAVIQLATRPEDIAGPTLAMMYTFIRDVAVPAIQNVLSSNDMNKPILIGDRFINWATFTSAYLPKFMELIDSVVSPDGWVRDSNGDILYNINNNWDRVALLAGAYPIKRASKKSIINILNRERAIRIENVRMLNTKMIKIVNRDKTLANVIKRLRDRLSEDRVLPEEVSVAMAEYVSKAYKIPKSMGDMMVALGYMNSDALDRRIEMSNVPPEERAVLRASLIQKVEAARLLLNR